MFYYETMFNTALNGIMTAGLMSTILTVAYGILLGLACCSAPMKHGPKAATFERWESRVSSIWR